MKNIHKKLSIILFSIFGLAMVAACEEDGYADYNAGGTATQAMNGEWYITITDEASGEVQVENALHKTYDNNGRLFITDRLGTSFTGWWLESALDANLSNLTFTATDETNFADESVVNITEGKIIKNGGRSTSGVVVDSIYFKAVFDYEPTQTLIYAGHKRTGFEEDEH